MLVELAEELEQKGGEMTGDDVRKPVTKVEISRDAAGEYRFAAKAGNGETVAVSEGYTRRESAVARADELFPDALIVDTTVV
jgi:hypothetical protein